MIGIVLFVLENSRQTITPAFMAKNHFKLKNEIWMII